MSKFPEMFEVIFASLHCVRICQHDIPDKQLLNVIWPFITERVAKRAKVMFSHVCVTSTPGGGWATPKVYHLPPGTRSQHLPSPDQARSQHLPPPWDQVTTPPSPPGPGHNTSLPPTPWDYAQVDGTHPTGMHSCSKIRSSNRQAINID